MYKERWDKADLLAYYAQTGKYLQSIAAPAALLQCNAGCVSDAHRKSINTYYNLIVHMLKRAAVGCVPKIPFRCLKPY